MALNSGSLKMTGPYPEPVRPHMDLNEPEPVDGKNASRLRSEQSMNRTIEDGILKIDNADGTTTIDFNPSANDLGDEPEDKGHTANLAKKMSEDRLGTIGSDLLEGVDRDEQSRKDWLNTRALGITLLGLQLEKPRSDTGAASAPLEGMSTVRHPLLLKATIEFQATARAELLPASGPVKVRNDSPIVPRSVLQTPNQADPDAPYPTLPPPEATSSS